MKQLVMDFFTTIDTTHSCTITKLSQVFISQTAKAQLVCLAQSHLLCISICLNSGHAHAPWDLLQTLQTRNCCRSVPESALP